MEIKSSWENIISIKNLNDKKIEINYSNNSVYLDWNFIDFPWEYEKSWILLEVKEYEEKFFYSFLIDGIVVSLILDDNFELKEEISDFLWDIDVLLIRWTKNSWKVIENIEARVIIPFWEWKDVLLNNMWQHKEEIEVFKIKSNEIESKEDSEIINIKL